MNKSLRLAIESLFTVIPERSSSEEITILCPEPGCGDRSGNRSISLRNGKTNCWRCNKGGKFVLWAKRLGYKISDDAMLEDVDLDQADDLLDKANRIHGTVPVYVVDIKLPKGFTSITDEPKSPYVKWIEKMAIRKHLTLKSFIRAGVGFTEEGVWEPFAIFPVTEWDKLVYYQGRTYNEEPGDVTKKFPSRKDVPYGSRYWVYNIDALRDKSVTRVIIVESILNVLSLQREIRRLGIKGIVPVAVFKHSVSKEQAVKLGTFKHVQEFCMMFDEDATASSWKTISHYQDLDLMGKFTVVQMPKGVDANDDAQRAMQLFQKRTHASPFSRLEWMANRL